MRTIAIGDIHGGLKALHQIFERAQVTASDRLIFLGDYVDGWSQSPQVLDFLIGLSETNPCVFLRGNHDDLLLDWLRGKENDLWYQHGGEATIRAYSVLPLSAKENHIKFLEKLHNYFVDEDSRLYVHAGFTNLKGAAHEYYPNMVFWDRTLWETAVSLDPNLQKGMPEYPDRFTAYHEIFIGHTPVTRLGFTTPQRRANVWNIDTGAAFRGKLTAIDVDSKEFFQSDNLPDLYPSEKGRN